MTGSPTGRFCWIDLAATDAARANAFYAELFGWGARSRQANGGTFVTFSQDGTEFASLYQLGQDAREAGVASHWTPYVRVACAQDACDLVRALGGRVVVEPFTVDGMARIAVVVDPVGAAFGMWEAAQG